MLVGDADGVVVVPIAALSEAASKLKAIATKEAIMDEVVAEGAPYPSWLDDILDSDAVSYID